MKIKIFLTVILLSKLIFSQADSSLIISEIMFNPNGSNTEFIEIYNISETDTIDLNNYKFKYYTSTADVIMSAGFGTSLPPKSFAVVLEGDYDFVSGIYNSLIPNSALILKISDNSFGASGMANTTDRPLGLLRPNNDTLEIKIYTANNSTGFSDEKKVMNKDTTVSNWGNSSINNGTPGYKNSITPLVNDISVSTFSLAQTNILLGNSFNLRAMVKNLGTNPAQNVLLKLYYDENNDNIPTPNEIIHQENINSIFSGDSIDIQYQYNPTQVGNYRFIAVAEYTSDENLNNNSKSVIGSVQTP
ncbi:MAG: lamin tail domain-containing protein, partial [Ignavibacteriaceae bacterium]|nr:lamin tail domain-containing protein [Ignavibacteriaceae bacterium]